MRLAGQRSWQVSIGVELPVDMALYLRDRLDLPAGTAPMLPALDPAVAVQIPDGLDPTAVAAEWPGWWADVLDWCRSAAPGAGQDALRALPVADTSPVLSGRPALRAALAVLAEPAARYQSSSPRPPLPPRLPVGEVVGDLERELGCRARPFRLVITEVRVQGLVWQRLTADHLLASTRFLDSPAALPALRDVLLSLA